eukprot:gene14612-18667_t
MSLAQSDSVESLQARGLFVPIPDDLVLVKGSSKKFTEVEPEFVVQSSFFKQVLALTEREFVASYRDTTGLMTRFGSTIVLGLVFGLIFLGVANQNDAIADNFNGHVGAISMLMILSMFASAQPVLLTFPFERPMFLREFTTGTYKAPAYFLSKLLIEVPMTFVQLMVQFIMVYYMTGLQGNFFLEFL